MDGESDDFIGAIHEFGKAVMGVGDVAGLVGAGSCANHSATGFDGVTSTQGDHDGTGRSAAVGESLGSPQGVGKGLVLFDATLEGTEQGKVTKVTVVAEASFGWANNQNHVTTYHGWVGLSS